MYFEMCSLIIKIMFVDMINRYIKGNRRAKIISCKIETTSRAYTENLIGILLILLLR